MVKYMKISCVESHLLFSENVKVTADIETNLVTSKNKEELLGIAIDY